MWKIILFIFSFSVLYSNSLIEGNNTVKEDVVSQVLKEVKENPKKITSSKLIKKDFKKIDIKSIETNIKNDIIDLKNKRIQIKSIIANGYLENKKYETILSELKKIKVHDFSPKYLENISHIHVKKIKENLNVFIQDLKKEFTKTVDLKNGLIEQLNKKYLIERSFIDESKIVELIKYINNNYSYNGFNVGKISVFFILFLFFVLLGYLFNHFIYKLFFKICDFKEDETEEKAELSLDIKIIKFPIFFLFTSIGIQMGIEILNYPNPLSEKLTLSFHVLNAINFVIIFVRSVDLIFFVGIKKEYIKIKRFEIINLFIRISKVIVVLIGLIYLLTLFGFDTNKLIASLGIGSLAIAYATKDFISRFFSGLKLIMDKNFSAGDWVKINTVDKDGVIIDIGFMNTTLRTFDNALLVIPNSIITNESYINWNRRRIGRKIGMKIGIKYDSKIEDIKQALAEIKEMLATNLNISPVNANFNKKRVSAGKIIEMGNELGLKNTLFVNLSEFADSAIIIDIYAFSKSVDWGDWRGTKEEIMFNIMEILKKNNLEFAFPTQSLYIENIPEIFEKN